MKRIDEITMLLHELCYNQVENNIYKKIKFKIVIYYKSLRLDMIKITILIVRPH
jgi:hypothetical protein